MSRVVQVFALLVSVAVFGVSCSNDDQPAPAAGSVPEASAAEDATSAPVAASEPPGEVVVQDPADLGAAEDVEEYLAVLEADEFNGVVLIAEGGDVDARGFGFADRESGVAFGPDTVFDIGSLTKQFTGAAILRLEMDGKLSVDDPLSVYVAGLPAPMAEITLHQLLTHTSELPSSIGGDYDPVDRDAFLALLADTPLLHEPGTQFGYSNVGYSLLAMVVETVTGGSYEAYLRDALFEPAGMDSTGYVIPDWDPSTVAIGYSDDDETGRPNELLWADDGPYWHLRGNGGLLSTANDMFLWHEALIGDEILSVAAKDKLYGRYVSENAGGSSFYGYGWSIVATPFDSWLVTHNGGNGIFFADFLRFLDEGVTIFVGTNQSRVAYEDLAFDLAGMVLGASVEGAASSCGFQDLTHAELRGFPTVRDFAADEAGAAAAEWFEVIATGDEAARLRYGQEHVSAELADGASDEEIADVIRELQDELDGRVIAEIHQESPLIYHTALSSTPEGDLVFVSLRLAEDEPGRVACLGVTR